MFFVLRSWSSASVTYSTIWPKYQILNVGHDYALWIRNFMVVIANKLKNLGFGTWPDGPCPNSNIWRDGIPSIGNFMLMINNHFALFQLPGKLVKLCAPYFRGNTQFHINFFMQS
jgi:hypothetical protein